VPYSIDAVLTAPGATVGSSSDAAAAVPVATLDAGGSPFSGEPPLMAPGPVSRWPMEGISLEALEGRVFVSALAGDADSAGAKEVFALVRPPDGSDPGELAVYRGAGTAVPPPTVIAPPPTLAHDASCSAIDRLVGIGNHSALVELGWDCPQHPSSAPSRWVAVVTAAATPRVLLAVTASDPVGAPTLSIDAQRTDRDGDGRQDIALRISVEGGAAPLEPGPRVAATLVWLDRQAGLSPDASATESSFTSLASAAAVRAARASEAPSVPRYVTQVRALWRAVCSDGQAPRVVAVAGTSAIRCGAARALEELGLAEAHAFATQGDALRAALALDRAQQPPAAHTVSRLREAQSWLTQLATVASARAVRGIAAVPLASHGHEPTWGTLAFEPSGKLLVKTRAGVVRVNPDEGDEAAAPDVAAWPSAVTSPDGTMQWIETYDPCDGLPLRATFAPASGDDMREVALPVAPRIGGRCAGSRGAPAQATPIAWGGAGLEAIVEDEPLLIAVDRMQASSLAGFLEPRAAAGSPRSPDGRTYVVPTASGLLVRGSGRSRLLRAKDLEGTYAEQRDCAVSNDASHVACVHVGHVWVGAWDVP
jgi:hypothetical protein